MSLHCLKPSVPVRVDSRNNFRQTHSEGQACCWHLNLDWEIPQRILYLEVSQCTMDEEEMRRAHSVMALLLSALVCLSLGHILGKELQLACLLPSLLTSRMQPSITNPWVIGGRKGRLSQEKKCSLEAVVQVWACHWTRQSMQKDIYTASRRPQHEKGKHCWPGRQGYRFIQFTRKRTCSKQLVFCSLLPWSTAGVKSPYEHVGHLQACFFLVAHRILDTFWPFGDNQGWEWQWGTYHADTTRCRPQIETPCQGFLFVSSRSSRYQRQRVWHDWCGWKRFFSLKYL